MDTEDVRFEINYAIDAAKKDLREELSIDSFIKQVTRGQKAIKLLEDLWDHLRVNKTLKSDFKNKIYDFLDDTN